MKFSQDECLIINQTVLSDNKTMFNKIIDSCISECKINYFKRDMEKLKEKLSLFNQEEFTKLFITNSNGNINSYFCSLDFPIEADL